MTFKIFQIPEAEVIILPLQLSSQNKNTSVFVFFNILTLPLTGATGGLTSTFTKAFGGGTNTGGGGVSLPLLALAGLYGKAVKEDFEGKQGGL